MALEQGNLIREVEASLSSVLSVLMGWRMIIPSALIVALVLLLGIGAALVVLIAGAGIGIILIIFRTNNRWIQSNLQKRTVKTKKGN